MIEGVTSDFFDVYCFSVKSHFEFMELFGFYDYIWVRVENVEKVLFLFGVGGSKEIILELEFYEGFGECLDGDLLENRSVVRVIVNIFGDCEVLLSGFGEFEVMVMFDHAMVKYFLESYFEGYSCLVLLFFNYELAFIFFENDSELYVFF